MYQYSPGVQSERTIAVVTVLPGSSGKHRKETNQDRRPLRYEEMLPTGDCQTHGPHGRHQDALLRAKRQREDQGKAHDR